MGKVTILYLSLIPLISLSALKTHTLQQSSISVEEI